MVLAHLLTGLELVRGVKLRCGEGTSTRTPALSPQEREDCGPLHHKSPAFGKFHVLAQILISRRSVATPGEAQGIALSDLIQPKPIFAGVEAGPSWSFQVPTIRHSWAAGREK